MKTETALAILAVVEVILFIALAGTASLVAILALDAPE
jgi:hypothetical protein